MDKNINFNFVSNEIRKFANYVFKFNEGIDVQFRDFIAERDSK